MKTATLTSIIVPENRQRTERDDTHIGSLMESIFSDTGAGLLNPITLRDGNTLVAGECRLQAITLGYKLGKTLRHAGQIVPAGEIPYIDFGDLPLLARMEAEFVENARRMDLPWQDKVRAQAELAKLMEMRTGEKPTLGEIAAELGTTTTPVQAALTLARHMNDKAIAGASTQKEAMKILKKKVDEAQRVKLAETVGKVAQSQRMRAFNVNCLEFMKGLPDAQYDVILTDPPYGMGADTFGDAAGKLAGTTHQYEDSRESTLALLDQCIPEFFRIAKGQSHLYLWCDLDLFHWLRDRCEAAGWWTHRTPLINIKPEGGRVPWPENGPRRCYEICLYAVKGKKPVTAIFPDVFESRLVEGNFGHGAQKPVEAYVNLLKRSVRPGDRVFDAFAGTGTIFAAAAALDLYADGTELEPAAFGTCIRRIQELG